MAGERYVVLALSRARAEWLRAVAHWTTAASIPVELVKCLSGEDLYARLESGRPCSAVLVEAGLPALDRDLIDLARRRGCALVVVENRRVAHDWMGLGAAATLPERFRPDQLLDALAERAHMIGRPERLPGISGPAHRPLPAGRVAMVCGPGGTGASTVAIALAQGLAHRQRNSVRSNAAGVAAGPNGDRARDAIGEVGHGVLLADFALHADQAMLHDVRDVLPGLQELIEAYRATTPAASELRSLVFAMEEGGYDVLLGLRRARGWVALRPRTVEAAFAGLRGEWSLLVCDADAELEGERETGSVDVEERHGLARTVAAVADVVFAVGAPGMKGTHSLVRVLRDLLDFGVPAGRVVPLVNRAPRGHRTRAEISHVCAALVARPSQDAEGATGTAEDRLQAPLFLPERRVDEALRDGVGIPSALVDPLVAAFDRVLNLHGSRLGPGDVQPGPRAERLIPGTLGHRSDGG